MDVVDARPDLVRIFEVSEGVEQLHLRARRLDRDDIGVHRHDGVNDNGNAPNSGNGGGNSGGSGPGTGNGGGNNGNGGGKGGGGGGNGVAGGSGPGNGKRPVNGLTNSSVEDGSQGRFGRRALRLLLLLQNAWHFSLLFS
jgi:hypothetical protein